MTVRVLHGAAVLGLSGLAVVTSACDRGADVWLVGTAVESSASGLADDGSSATPAETYGADPGDLWAEDSLTTAYSDPPRPGRLAGGVAAQPSDTVPVAGAPAYATARSVSRVAVPLEVRSGGRVELELALRLSDVEIAGAGVPRVRVAGTLATESGEPLPGGDLGGMVLEIGPNGEVLVDGMPDDPDQLLPDGSYDRTVRGPVGALRLDTGEYRVVLELALDATAPASSGGYQLARIGQATATLRVP